MQLKLTLRSHINIIKPIDTNTDSEIEEYIKNNTVLLILDDKDIIEYKGIKDGRNNTFKELAHILNINSKDNKQTPQDNSIIITVSKFFLLVIHGIISISSYNMIIIKNISIRKELIESYKYFYYSYYRYKYYGKRDIKVIIYTLDDKDYRILLNIHNLNDNYNNIDNRINDNYNNIDNKYNELIQVNDNNKEEIDIILYDDNKTKYDKLIEILEKYKNRRIFITLKNKNQLSILKEDYNINIIEDDNYDGESNTAISTDISNITIGDSIVIFYDYFIDFKCSNAIIIYFHAKKDNFGDIIRIKKILNSASVENEKKSVEYVMSDNGYVLGDGKNAIILFDFSYSTLIHILVLIKEIFECKYLFISDVCNISVSYKQYNDGASNYVCVLSLPCVHHSYIFNCTFISGLYSKKRDAQKDLALKIIREMVKEELVDKHLIPDTRKFIEENNKYKELLANAYLTRDNKDEIDHKNDIIMNIHNYNSIPSDNNINNNISIENNANNTQNITEIENNVKQRVAEIKTNNNDKKREIKKRYSIFVNKKSVEDKEMGNLIEKTYRKLPECFKEQIKDNNYHLYNFINNKNSKLGILCGRSFTEDVKLPTVSISYLGPHSPDELELKYIIFYQIVYFSLFYNGSSANSNSRNYYYYIVPIKDKKINIEYMKEIYSNFLISNVYNAVSESNSDILSKNILFNPFTRQYYVYAGISDKKITDVIANEDNGKERNTVCKGIITDEYESSTDINANKEKKKSNGKTYHQYFEEKYNIRLLYSDSKYLLFKGYLYNSIKKKILNNMLNDDKMNNNTTGNIKDKISIILSSEITHITNFKIEEIEDFKLFMENFYIFESVALGEELKKIYSIQIELELLVKGLTRRVDKEEDYNYERLEFLGDTILKYLVSIHYFLCVDDNLGEIVDLKCDDICNKNLYDVALKYKINRYFTMLKYHPSLFQTPCVDAMRLDDQNLNSFAENTLKFFRAANTFMSNSQTSFLKTHCSVEEDTHIIGKKIYADVIEAIVGGVFLSSGMEVANHTLYKLGILKDNDKKEIIDNNISNHPNPNLNIKNSITIKKLYNNHELLTTEEIKYIESKIQYKFNNKSILEKAIVHPSYIKSNYEVSLFHKLELLGDTVLDIIVTMEGWLYNNKDIDITLEDLKIHIKEIETYNKEYTLKNITPEDLHTHRRMRVNNQLLGTVLYQLELFSVIKTHRNNTPVEIPYKEIIEDIKHNRRISKIYGDITEALCGAILIDSNFNIEVFYRVYKDALKIHIEA